MPVPAQNKKYSISNLRTEERTFTIEDYDETFHCIPEAPGGLMETLVSGIDYDPNGNEIYHSSSIRRFIEMVLVEEREVAQPVPREDGSDEDAAVTMVMEPTDDMQRWRALMQDKKRPVPLETLVEIVRDLSEYYNDRPTAPSRR